MLKKIVFSISLIWSFFAFGQGEIDDLFYLQNRHYYNVSSSPLNDSLSGDYAIDLRTYIKQAPYNIGRTIIPSISYQAFMKKENWIIGLNYNRQPLSFTTQNEAGIALLHSFNIKDTHLINIGVRGGFSFYNLDAIYDYSFLIEDNLKNNLILPDLDVGMTYCFHRFEIGVAGKNLFASHYSPAGTLLKNNRDLYVHLSYDFLLGKRKRIAFKPVLMSTPTHVLNSYLGLELGLYNKVFIEYSCRFSQIRNQFVLTYRILEKANIGLAFTQSMIRSDYNYGLRLAYQF